jgi:HSP20 family protein
MARQQSEKKQESQAMEPRRRESMSRSMPWSTLPPFSMMRRLAEEMDRAFDDFRMPMRLGRTSPWGESAEFQPAVDMFERDGRLIVRADLPGMSRDDVTVDITPDSVRIEGERKYEHESQEEGVYRTERSYGSFCREIPLPQGIKTDDATAKFKDGVLEVSFDASEMNSSRRRLKIDEETTNQPGKSAA